MLEKRGDRTYYYRYERVDGRARRVYAGAGAVAEAAADRDLRRRQARLAERDRQRQAAAAVAEPLAALDRLDRLLRLVAGAALTRAGFHQHARGAWRRKRQGGGDAG